MSHNDPMNVLAADDDDMNLFILSKNLRGTGYIPIEAEDGAKAWQYITQNPSGVDIMMVDRMMPGINGLDLIRKVRSQPSMRFTPIIMQSGKVGTDILKDAYCAGADGYLIKPFSEKDMKNMVDKAKYDVERHSVLMDLLDNPSSLSSSSVIILRTMDEAYVIAASLAQKAIDKIGVACAILEILINAIEHGNLEIGLENKKRLIANSNYRQEIEYRLAQPIVGQRVVTVEVDEFDDKRVITIQDEGKGFEWQRYTTFDAGSITQLCGQGINKAINLLEKVEFLENGNKVRCHFDIE